MVTLNVGTKELMSIDLADRIQGISDISPYVVQACIKSEDELTTPQAYSNVANKVLMRVDVLIDTTVGLWSEGTYKLYLKITIAPEVVILGPVEFGLS